jgi:hypothetical protein
MLESLEAAIAPLRKVDPVMTYLETLARMDLDLPRPSRLSESVSKVIEMKGKFMKDDYSQAARTSFVSAVSVLEGETWSEYSLHGSAVSSEGYSMAGGRCDYRYEGEGSSSGEIAIAAPMRPGRGKRREGEISHRAGENNDNDHYEDEQKVFLGGLPQNITPEKLIIEVERQGFDVLNIPVVHKRGFCKCVVLESSARAIALVKKGCILLAGKKVDVRKFRRI